MNTMKSTFVLVMAIVQAHAAPLTKDFIYVDDACTCKATADVTKNTLEEIQGALKLSKMPILGSTHSWASHSKMSKETAKTLKLKSIAQFDTYRSEVKKLPLPKDSQWEKLRQNHLNNIDLSSYLDLGRLGYIEDGKSENLTKPFNGEALPEECRKFAEALQSGPETEELFKKTSEAHCRTNINPSECLKSNILMGEKNYLLVFGWYNCANNHWRTKLDLKELYEAQNALIKTFLKNDCECEEP